MTEPNGMPEPDAELLSQLNDALRDVATDTPANLALRSTIRTGIVRDDPTLVDLYERIVGPEQAEVDFHLDGAGVEGHATNAKLFSKFVSGISEAVKETAKAKAGKGRYTEGLLIDGGPGPGSVRVVLRAPEPPATAKNEPPLDPSLPNSTVESEALRSVAAILSHASSEEEDSPMLAELTALPMGARRGLKRVANSARDAGWEIKGSIRQRNYGATNVELTADGAFRLKLGLDAQIDRRADETVTGTIDGFRRSLSTLYFQPAGGGRIIQAAVSDGALADSISELFADKNSVVEVVFDVIESFLPGDDSRIRKSRSVRQVRRLALGRQMELSDDDESSAPSDPPSLPEDHTRMA
ncbi:MAG: hypothetical protein C0482_16115 [Gordonia sp.]|nr:hypothetical protein [Gordonia sp. (in: high G+C Gram-positive bacteria)]